jgi:integrase
LLDTARKNAFNASPESYVFESPLTPGKPLGNSFFRESVAKELESIGITAAQQRGRVLTCHSLRHTFITLAQLSGISDVEIRALAGHKSEKIMRQYSHVPQVIDFNGARKKLEENGANEPKAANEQ